MRGRVLRWLPLGGTLLACWACKADTSFMDGGGIRHEDAGAADVQDASSERDGVPRLCELLSQKGCGGAAGAYGCYPDTSRSGATVCAANPIPASTPGSPCTVTDEALTCAPGQICVPPTGSSADGAGICLQLCPTNIAGIPCPEGRICTALAGYPSTGYCALP